MARHRRRQTAHWKATRLMNGTIGKRCSKCRTVNREWMHVCRGCGRVLIKQRKAKRPPRGSDERVRQELAYAAKMSDLWASKAKRAATLLHQWNRRERALSRRLLEGPPPKREPKPKVRRGIKLAGLAPGAVVAAKLLSAGEVSS